MPDRPKPEVYETQGITFAKASGNAPTPDVGQREAMIDGELQSIPNCISRKFINAGGCVVLVPVHTSRESKKENPYSPYSSYSMFVERVKLRHGWVDWKTGHHRPDKLRCYEVRRPLARPVPGTPGTVAWSVDERDLVKDWPAHRDELIEARRLKHTAEDAHYKDQAQDMLEKELRHMTKGVADGIAQGFAAAVKQVADMQVAQAQAAAAGEPVRRGPGRPPKAEE